MLRVLVTTTNEWKNDCKKVHSHCAVATVVTIVVAIVVAIVGYKWN